MTIQEIWNESTPERKRQIVQVALARSKNVHSDTIQQDTIIGCNPDIEAELAMLVGSSPLYTTADTTFSELLSQLGLK